MTATFAPQAEAMTAFAHADGEDAVVPQGSGARSTVVVLMAGSFMRMRQRTF